MTSQRTPAPWALIDPAVQLARQASPAAGRYLYSVYGISIRSDVPLPFPMRTLSAWFEIEIHNHEGPIPQSLREEIRFEQNLSSAFDVGSFPDGANYVGLKGLGEILISSDGRSLACYCESESTSESLYVYVLGQALSFALVKNGIEPLHATGVVVHGEAVVFLGDCGFG